MRENSTRKVFSEEGVQTCPDCPYLSLKSRQRWPVRAPPFGGCIAAECCDIQARLATAGDIASPTGPERRARQPPGAQPGHEYGGHEDGPPLRRSGTGRRGEPSRAVDNLAEVLLTISLGTEVSMSHSEGGGKSARPPRRLAPGL